MLIIPIAFISCIVAVDIDPETVRSVAHSLLKLGRMSGNQQLSSNLAKHHTYKSLKEIWSSNSIPNLVVSHKILPFLTFREAINAKVMDEQEIIKYFASKEYNDPKSRKKTYYDIANYIVRDLENNKISEQNRINNFELFFHNANIVEDVRIFYDNVKMIFEYGKLDLLKYSVGNKNLLQFRDFKYLPLMLAAQNGHIQMVKWLLKQNPTFDNYKSLLLASIYNDKKRTFEAILETGERFYERNNLDILNLALASSFFYNFQEYVDFVLSFVSKKFKDKNSLSRFGESFLKMYSKPNWHPSVENLDNFFKQEAWNPRTVSSLLTAMSKAPDGVVERIGKELLNPRLKFRDSTGSDPLKTAIEMASQRNQARYGKVKQVLENIQKKRSVDVGEQDLSAKRSRLQEPVYLDGFGLGFHPVD